ncbi:MAG TPA: hypothetical protein VFK02_35760 [Kofleriaceae bacterium]|nr:hypothetical protein [Kofleriaceae bacterium]
MTRPRVVLRADASHAIGVGHVARIAALVEAMTDDAGPHRAEPVALIDGDPALGPWLAGRGIPAPPRPVSTDDVLAAAAGPGVRAVVIDGPPLAAALAPALLARGVRTVVIDDRGDLPLPVSAVVNHNFHAPALADTYPAAQLRLLGRRYLLLGRAIRRHPRGACRPRASARLRVVVSFGGSDPVGATARTLRLVPPDRPLALIVLLGPGFRDHAPLAAAAAAARAAGHHVALISSPGDPGPLFVAADAAICAAGGTLGELAYLGCPALAFAIVADQVAGASAQTRAGLIAGGAPWSETSDAALRTALAAFVTDDAGRRARRERALDTADGGGAGRVISEALG